MARSPGLNYDQATALIQTVCDVAGARDLIADAHKALKLAGVVTAIQKRDDNVLFNWFVRSISYQGVSDAVASGYMDAHGTADAKDIRDGLTSKPLCPKLYSFDAFTGCGYRKAKRSCGNVKLIDSCPLPRLDLRNGSLNQAAFGLYLFMRDVAGGDFVGWIDRTLNDADSQEASGPDALIAPLIKIHGLSFKVLNLTLATLLLAGGPHRGLWQTAGSQMIAVDTLVHAWLHRTGILRGLDAEHNYGPGCYYEGRCADIIRAVSQRIDSRTYNADYPRVFSRFVQYAIWRFCAQQKSSTSVMATA